jgi:hypothetical protein
MKTKVAAKPVVSSLVWEPAGSIHQAQRDAVESLGFPHQFFLYDEPIPSNTDIVLIQGPYGSLTPLICRLMDFPPGRRPVLAYWFQQSLDMAQPDWARLLLAYTFSDLHRHHQEAGTIGQLLNWAVPGIVNTKGRRLSFLGDILWLHHHGLLDVLALSSSVYADYVAQRGIPSILVPRGYHPLYGSILHQPRDIALVWMGKLRTRRRAQAVNRLQAQLSRQGLVMHIYDGVRNDFIEDDRRTNILNRTWFVLNVNFSGPTDELSLRFYVAGANGAVVLMEHNDNQYPFIPGKHLVESPLEEMPRVIQHYLNHPNEWCAISESMSNLLRGELALERSISTILAEAGRHLENR